MQENRVLACLHGFSDKNMLTNHLGTSKTEEITFSVSIMHDRKWLVAESIVSGVDSMAVVGARHCASAWMRVRQCRGLER